MKLEDFDYPLPKELIAQKPLDTRDDSRLLAVDRGTGALADRRFREVTEYFEPGDVLVVNDTKVFPARLLGRKKGTGGKVDVLLLSPAAEANAWRCLVQPGLKEGQAIEFPEGAEAVFLRRGGDGIPVVEFRGVDDVRALAEKIGTMPLPPYIKREPEASDVSQYQTVYAEKEGAVAAPTAGLHFTGGLLSKLRAKEVRVSAVTLHVGYGTFKPVEDLEGHRMHAESFELSEGTAEAVNSAKAAGKKIWAVGTTSLRVLETCVRKRRVVPGKGETDLYIFPPFRFEAADRLITNFHLPKTTLLLLVSAFMGEALRKKAYEHAVRERYRFYSYGDAMAIL